uniref:Uncharacterized protein n=1 Tax=Candidatus Kentrum sp. TC TaxID=2126339 RepID=A0A450YID4_9GAMM|nr:MAG: hypothetical protein BECKTC1821E_GA0114239_101019 [Candidatus Kentron sp. TC]
MKHIRTMNSSLNLIKKIITYLPSEYIRILNEDDWKGKIAYSVFDSILIGIVVTLVGIYIQHRVETKKANEETSYTVASVGTQIIAEERRSLIKSMSNIISLVEKVKGGIKATKEEGEKLINFTDKIIASVTHICIMWPQNGEHSNVENLCDTCKTLGHFDVCEKSKYSDDYESKLRKIIGKISDRPFTDKELLEHQKNLLDDFHLLLDDIRIISIDVLEEDRAAILKHLQ